MIENAPAAAITLSWIQLVRRRVVLSLPGHVAVEGPPSLHPAPHSLPQPIPRFNQILWSHRHSLPDVGVSSPPIVVLGPEPSIQGYRSVACPWTLGSGPGRKSTRLNSSH